ncbi:MAG TPA: NAD-dependent epimerase/dehydratase family protein [Planctomycetota bacterium]|nr:NAD-dependent epimerase/dehydratase family protein [Planctomycetota bacterium]
MSDAADLVARYRGVPVLVVGAAGFLGTHVARAALRAGARVRALVSDRRRLAPDVARGADRVLEEQQRKPAHVAAAAAWSEASLVVNCAGAGVRPEDRDEAALRRDNAALPAALVDAAANLAARDRGGWGGVRLIHLGSALEYGTGALSLDEAGDAAPDEPYGASKLAGTRAVVEGARARGVPALAARLFTVFGAGEPAGRLLPTLWARRSDDGEIPLTAGLQKRDFAYAEDVAEALLRLAAVPGAAVAAGAPPFDGGVVNLATGRLTAVRDFVTLAARAFGVDPARLAFGRLPSRPDDTRHPPTPIDRLRAALGGRVLPDDLADALRRAASACAAASAGTSP